MKNSKQTIGQRIKELRESRDMTQAELAELLFASDTPVSKWEKDKSEPEYNILIKIAELFGVTLDYLLTGTNPDVSGDSLSKIELACREDNIALLAGVDIKAPDQTGKDIKYYANKYKAENISKYLLNLEIEESIKEKKYESEEAEYHICAIPKDMDGEDNLELIASGVKKDNISLKCESFSNSYKKFKIFKEVHLFQKVDRDYQWLDINFLNALGFHKMSMHIGLLDDMKSGILGFSIYKDKTYDKNITVHGHKVPDYYPESDIEYKFDCYVRPEVLDDFVKLLEEVDFKHWENKHWGCALYNIFYALKDKDNPMYEKFYVNPGKAIYSKFIRGLQKLCVESMNSQYYKLFTRYSIVEYRPYYREDIALSLSMKIFEKIEDEEEQIKSGNFDIF